MPAEWRSHEATWLSWPKDPETWPKRVPQVQNILLQMMAALAPHEIVNLLVDDEETEIWVRARCTFAAPRTFAAIALLPSIRGYATMVQTSWLTKRANWPTTIGALNAWGNKYEQLKQTIPSTTS